MSDPLAQLAGFYAAIAGVTALGAVTSAVVILGFLSLVQNYRSQAPAPRRAEPARLSLSRLARYARGELSGRDLLDHTEPPALPRHAATEVIPAVPAPRPAGDRVGTLTAAR